MTTKTSGAIVMRSIPWVDRFAIGLSLLCLMHCLLMPILLVALPVLNASLLGSETIHLWLVYAIIPSSLFALAMGCKQHHRQSFLVIGGGGLSLLVLGVSIDLIGLDHIWESVFTVLGTLLIGLAHLRNFQLCRKSTHCACH